MSGVDWPWAARNGARPAPLERMLDESAVSTPATVRRGTILVPWLATSAVVLVLTLLRSRRSVDHLFGLTTLGALLLSPLGWL